MTLALFASRFVHFAAVMVLFGASLFPLYAAEIFRVSGVFRTWLWRVLLLAALVSLLSSLSWLSLEAAMMGEGWPDAVSGATLATVLLQTEFGRVWIVHLALAGMVLLALLAARGGSRIRATIVLAVLSAVLVASLAATGHAVIRSGSARAIDVTAQVIHLLGASIWLGGLIPLGYLLVRAQKEPHAWLAAARLALPRYSRAGLAAVGLILLTGIFASWQLVGSPRALGDTGYGRLLLVKIALVLAMIGFALVNRLDYLPKLLHRDAPASAGSSLRKLSRNVAIEQALGVAVLAVVSVLGMLPPGGHSDADSALLTASPRTLALDTGENRFFGLRGSAR